MRCYVFAVCVALFSPLKAVASCDTAAVPSYDDITYVKVAQFSLVGQAWPAYTYEGWYYRFGQNGPHANASLNAQRAVRIRGTYVAVDAVRAFSAIVTVLKKANFFELRLHPTKNLYLDGPEDAITVSRCGITETIGTDSGFDEMDTQDAQAKAFFALEADLRSMIFAQRWETPPPQQ